MKLRYRYDFDKTPRVYSVAEAVCRVLSSYLHDGELENMRNRLSKLEELVAFLVEALHNGEKLTDEQVLHLVSVFDKVEETR